MCMEKKDQEDIIVILLSLDARITCNFIFFHTFFYCPNFLQLTHTVFIIRKLKIAQSSRKLKQLISKQFPFIQLMLNTQVISIFDERKLNRLRMDTVYKILKLPCNKPLFVKDWFLTYGFAHIQNILIQIILCGGLVEHLTRVILNACKR